MKLNTVLILPLSILFFSGTMFCEKKEKTNFFTRTYHFGVGSGSLALSLAQIGSATTIAYYAYTSVAGELQDAVPDKILCAAASLIGLVSTPTLLYAGWRTGQFSVQSLRTAFKRIKKTEPAPEFAIGETPCREGSTRDGLGRQAPKETSGREIPADPKA